jgi:RNA polymerase sigma-70 factor (ECF subfamily)
MTENDRYYVVRCLDGHPDDFRYLVQRYQSMLIANLTGQLGSYDRAEEATQETLVRAYFHLNRLKKPNSFFSWLLGISNRVAKEQRRKEKSWLRRVSSHSLPEEAPAGKESQHADLQKALSALPENYRQVILLRYYGERSCRQIAEQLEIPLGTVTKTLSRAYAMLRQSLQQD